MRDVCKHGRGSKYCASCIHDDFCNYQDDGAEHEKSDAIPKQAKPLRFRTGLPLDNKGDLTDDVFISFTTERNPKERICIGKKGEHPFMEFVVTAKHIPLSEIMALVE